jgi:hypothetical protein
MRDRNGHDIDLFQAAAYLEGDGLDLTDDQVADVGVRDIA